MKILQLNSVSKYFSVNNTQAVDNMSLSVEKGEIHAVVGENGAGKSTLMKIIHGVERCDSGELNISGKTGMVSQHFRLIESLSILENIIIGKEPIYKAFFINKNIARNKVKTILETYGFKLDIDTKIKDLSIGQKQLVEIIKVIYNNADILIFDEPTSALSELEAQKFRKTVLSLKNRGKTIIIISHKIKDISSISDRFTIMRKGKYIETVTTNNVNISEISKHMSGSDIVETVLDRENKTGKKLFSFTYKGEEITLHQSEIIGITGHGNCGLHELEDYLMEISLNNNKIGYTPSDRLTRGVELNSKLKESLIAPKIKSFSKLGILNSKKIDRYAKKLISDFNIAGSLNCQTGTLSGGNLQKLVLARVLDEKPETLILCAPTWGIDIESANGIYSRLKELKENKKGIILLSSDAEEIIKLSNRVYIMYKGKFIKEINNIKESTTENIGRLSAGLVSE